MSRMYCPRWTLACASYAKAAHVGPHVLIQAMRPTSSTPLQVGTEGNSEYTGSPKCFSTLILEACSVLCKFSSIHLKRESVPGFLELLQHKLVEFCIANICHVGIVVQNHSHKQVEHLCQHMSESRAGWAEGGMVTALLTAAPLASTLRPWARGPQSL